MSGAPVHEQSSGVAAVSTQVRLCGLRRLGKTHVWESKNMSAKIKMIGLDLDGTLLTDRKELTARTKNVIAEAIRQGIIVLVATGRPWMGVPEELREFPGMKYALTSNGARILDACTGRVIEEHLLSPELAKKSLEICGKYDTLQEVYFDGQGYAEAEKMAHVEKYHKNPNMWEYMRKTRIPAENLTELIDRENRGLDKTQALFADMGERTRAWAELERVDGLELVGSLKYNIEINAAGVNKGAGLISLGKLLGIKREEIMACGDGDNDAVMLREAGFGVAMANAEEQVKEAADYITLSNEEEGVAFAIEKFALEGGKGVC